MLRDGCDAAVSSRLAFPEVRAAMGAAGRAGHLRPAELRRAVDAWEEFWAATRAVEPTDSVAVHAGDRAGRFALRGADALHLASLLAIGSDDILFAVWEQGLRAGTSAAGVHAVPESPSPR